MVSLDPDDFLADLADVPDHPSRPFPEKAAEEEELEWLSNKDSFPALEICMLPEEPPRQQKAIPNAEQGSGALLMPPMPGRKTKEDSCKAKSMKVCTFCGVSQTPKGPEDASGACNACGFSYKKSIKGEKVKNCESDKVKDIKKKCTHCEITNTPMWRAGPGGPKTLCNACGVRYRSGRLCPEYRPANSPTFLRESHSNLHRKVMKMRKQIPGIKGTVSNPVNKCTNSAVTTALKKMKNDMVPNVSTVNILEQPRRGVIADQQSPVSVLQNNTKGSSILDPHQSPRKFLGQQQLFCDQFNNKLNPEDTAKVEVGKNTTTLMSSYGTVKVSYKVPNKILQKQQLFSCQPTNKRRKKNTVKLKNEGNNATLMSSCGNLEPPHQLPSEFLEQHQLFSDQPNHNCNKKHTAKVEMTVKPVDVSTLMKSSKDSLPAVETLNILDHSRGHFIAEQRSPVLVHQNSTNSSATLMSSCEKDELPHQSPSKIFSEQLLVYNPDNNNPNKKDSAKVEIEGNSTSTMSSCGTSTLPHQAPNEFTGQQELFFGQHNNSCNNEDIAIVGTEVKCQNCGAKQSLQQREDPLGSITLCLSCTLAKHTARRKRSTSLASKKRRKKEDTAKAEMAGKPGDKCTNSSAALEDSKKDPFVNTSNISEQPNAVVISEQQTPSFVFGNSIIKKCTHCEITQTPQWRQGPHGPRTLCNACGVRYKSGRLCPEYRPANSPTFLRELHSNCHKKIMEMRKQMYGIEGEVAKHVDKRTNSAATTALENMKKDVFPTVTTVNILEKPSKSVISEQQSPVSVLENNINSSTTLESQPPSKLPRQQQLVCNQLNNKNNQEDTAKVEVERNTSNLMSSHGTIKLSDKVPTTVLEKQHLFNCQPTNKRRKKNTVKLKNEGNNATLMSFCGNIEPPHQVPSEFLEQHQLFYDQPNNDCNKKHTATVEMTMKPVDICGTLMKSKKDSFPAVEALNILDHSRGLFIAEQRSPILVLQNSTNSSATLMSSCETVELSHQSPSKIFRQQLLFHNPGNNLPDKKDTAQVEIEENNTSTISSCGTLTLPHQAPNEFPGQQQLLFEQPNDNCNQFPSDFLGQQNQFFDQTNYKPKKKDASTVEIEENSSTLMRSSGTLELPNQSPNEFQEQQQLLCKQARNMPSKKGTARVGSEENSTNLMIPCGTSMPPHQAHIEFLGQLQLFYNQVNNETNKENAAKVESEGKCQNCGDEQSPRWLGSCLGPKTLCLACGLAKCTSLQQRSNAAEVGKMPHPLPTTKPSDIANSEYQKHFSVLENSTNNSIDLLSSCRITIPHRARSKGLCRRRSTIPGQQVGIGDKCMQCGKQTNRWRMGPLGPTTLCNTCGNKYPPLWGIGEVTVDIAKCQHCGSEETTRWLMCPLGTKIICAACYHWIMYGRQQFCNQTSNNPDRKASSEVVIERKCYHCGVIAGPMGSETLCNACRFRWYKLGDRW